MNEQTRGMIIGGLAGLLLGVLLMMLFGQGELDDVSIGGSETGFKIELKSKKMTTEVLEQIWKNPNFKPVLVDWLKRKDYISVKDDKAIAARLSDLSPKDPLAKTIIDLRQQNEGPFQILADSARLVKPDYRIPDTEAYTWRGSVLVGKKIEFSFPDAGVAPVVLTCKGQLGARPPYRSALLNTFHVNKQIFKALVGNQNRDPDKAAEGWVYVSVLND